MAAQAQSENYAPTPGKWAFQFGALQDHSRTEPVAQITLGYDINPTFSVEAVVDVSLLFMRVGGLDAGVHEFNSAIGLRALATLPLGERWTAVGGLGLVQFDDEVGNGSGHNDGLRRISPMASASLMWRKSRRWSYGLEVASFTSSHAISEGLRAEFHF